MVELQSCANLVNASALCAIEEEIKDEGVNVISEISAELQRERQKNAELLERISLLEAQIQERGKISLLNDGQGGCANEIDRSFKKFKRQKIEPSGYKIEDGSVTEGGELHSRMKHDTHCLHPKLPNLENCLVNWMSMDDTQFLHFENFKDAESAADYEDTDDSDDEDDDYCEEDDIDIDRKDKENEGNSKAADELKEHPHEGLEEGLHIACTESSSVEQSKATFSNVSYETNMDQKKICLAQDTKHVYDKKELKIHDKKETKMNGGHRTSSQTPTSKQEASHKGSRSNLLHGKPLKLAFCPKEVKRIIDSEALLLKNAQSHTIRKIIVFASLGIRHGCEDMYELDFNHFTILRKGEPYVSPKNPGEHVVYENPGVRRKVFYPNRQNQTLCPVQILEEEKAMRPPDASCPSYLFLCIKYGGRTRNLPQNEYVRQRMGRNKLKSFGPVMCRMAMLVHIRCGSFFFKALGITLLFMAGFPDDLVQRETKYRNLDLLQKYFRSDESAEGEELFLPHPLPSDNACPNSQQLIEKAASTKSKGKKQPSSTSKPQNLRKSSILHCFPPTSAPPTQFGLMGYNSIHTHTMASNFQPMSSHITTDNTSKSNPEITSSNPIVPYCNPTPYPFFPSQPPNNFMPVVYWTPPNALPPCPYPSSYGYQSLSSTGNYIPFHPQPYYYSHSSSNHFIPKIIDGSGQTQAAMQEAESDSDCSSSSTEPKNVLASCE